ncbi:MAG: hypothetical protein Q9M15_03750 [Mariprofundaceae bacterium]|nr:hypothetical protein [Mariprofundaceae bacterium]
MNKIVIMVGLGISISLLPTLATAKKVYSPIVTQGEVEVETQSEVFRSKNPAENGKQKHQLELSYGITDNWHSGVYIVYEKNLGQSMRYTQSKWANIIQLTEQGKYWVDMGVYAEYIRYKPSLRKADVLELKLLFERPVKQWKHTLNLVFKQPLWGINQSSMGLGYAWRSRYKTDMGLEAGIEAYGSLGTNKQVLLTQRQLIGPVIEYTFNDTVEVNAGWLMSSKEGPAYGDFKLNMEVKF